MKYFLVTLFACYSLASLGQNAAQWRGENRDGSYNETNLLSSWPEAGPELLWMNETIGNGYGSVAAVDGKVFVNGEVDSISYVFAFDTMGKLLWKSTNGPGYVGEGFSGNFPGARSTPTVVNQEVYSCSGLGRIACYDIESGTEKWAIDMLTDLHGIPNYFGYAESLLVDGDALFCYPGGQDTNMVALDRFSGEIRWISKALSDTVIYCSPTLIELPTQKLIVTFSGRNLLGLDAATGKLLWSHKQTIRKYNQHCNTSIYHEGNIYYLSSHGNGLVKLALSEDGSSITEVWSTEIDDNSFNGFCIKDEKLYATIHKLKLAAFDLHTGEITDSLRVKKGSVITADQMLYCYSENGTVSLVNIADEKMEVISKLKVTPGSKEHFSTPVISQGVLYVRHGNALLAYNIKDESINQP